MKITNNSNFPEAIVKAVSSDKWYGGSGEKRDYSVTGLLNTPRIHYLTKRHYDEIVTDCAEMIWMLMGSAMHLVLENANQDSENHVIEDRFSYTTKSGKVITGGLDSIDKLNKVIEDWKFTSVYTWIYRNRNGNSRLKDYEKQLNMYRFLAEKAGYDIDNLRIHMIFRDWSKSKAKYEKDYPNQIETLQIDVWGLDAAEAFIEERVAEFEKYKDTPDDELPVCTPEERWQSHTTWAVRKLKNKTASKVLFSYASAKEWLNTECSEQAFKKTKMNSGEAFEKEYEKLSKEFVIEKREGEPIRCSQGYCSCRDFCSYYKSLNK